MICLFFRNCFLTPVGDSGSHDDVIVPVSQPSSFTVDNIHSGETTIEQVLFTCLRVMQPIVIVASCCCSGSQLGLSSLTSGSWHCHYWHLIVSRQNVGAIAKCFLCYEFHVRIAFSYLHDVPNSIPEILVFMNPSLSTHVILHSSLCRCLLGDVCVFPWWCRQCCLGFGCGPKRAREVSWRVTLCFRRH